MLAAPTTHGFDLVAWIAPFAVFAAALLGTILLIRRWGGLRAGRQLAAEAETRSELDRRAAGTDSPGNRHGMEDSEP